ncbi:MAG: hypothetical protein ACI3WR_03725, partial [Oscillospiraceae bacterium]
IRQWLLEDIPKTPKEMGELIYLAATRGWEGPEGAARSWSAAVPASRGAKESHAGTQRAPAPADRKKE